jgi:hypothetical protein
MLKSPFVIVSFSNEDQKKSRLFIWPATLKTEMVKLPPFILALGRPRSSLILQIQHQFPPRFVETMEKKAFLNCERM